MNRQPGLYKPETTFAPYPGTAPFELLRHRRQRVTTTGHRMGEWHQNARLSDDDVRCLREMHKAGVAGYRVLAYVWGCGMSTIRDVVTYRTRTDA